MMEVRAMSRRQLYHPTNLKEHLANRLTHTIGSWPLLLTQTVLFFCSIAVILWSHTDFFPLLLFLMGEGVLLSLMILIVLNRQTRREQRRDDLEAEEIQSLYTTHELLLRINRQQLDLLKLLEDR
jgi:uncharacterized membrane protein